MKFKLVGFLSILTLGFGVSYLIANASTTAPVDQLFQSYSLIKQSSYYTSFKKQHATEAATIDMYWATGWTMPVVSTLFGQGLVLEGQAYWSVKTPTPTTTTTPPPSSGFVTSSGTSLSLNGQPYTFVGLNYFQANITQALPCWNGNANSGLDSQLTAMGPGHNMIRAWFFQSMATTNGVRDWAAFDHTLAVAKAHGYKVIATLADQWGYCGEGPYKDEAWYQGGYKTTVQPGDTVPYRAWVQEVTARYKNEPTFAIWELVNEPEDQTSASNYTCPADAEPVMHAFASDVSALIKSVDPNHLVSLGTEANGNCGTNDTDFAKVMAISTLDIGSVHDYWGGAAALGGDPYNGIQQRINQCKVLNKPIYTGESGIRVQDVSSLQQRADYFAAKISAQFNAGVSGFVAWNWWPTGPSADYQIGAGDPTLPILKYP